MEKVKQVHQDVEHGSNKGQTRLDIHRQSVPNPFQITDDRDQRQGRFDTHPLVPRAFLANLHVLWNTVLVAKTIIRQRHGLSIKSFSQRVKALIVDIHCVPIPGDYPTEVIHQPAQLDSNAPAACIFAFFAHVLWTSAVADGKHQFNRIAVNDREKSWVGHEPLTPRVMGFEQPL